MNTYHLLFSIAVVSMALGAGLLVLTTGWVSVRVVFGPLVIIAAGVLATYFSAVNRWNSVWFFCGSLGASGALVRFTASLLHASVADYWPLFAIVMGISVLATSVYKYGRPRPSSLVVSASFVLLGLFFSIFSFGFSSIRFKTFISMWWPALFIAAGLLLIVVWLLRRKPIRGSVEARADSPPDAGGDSS
ncbi:MAG: hypothetical protein JXM71_08460 [Spirochaetales bacterium]|nr:hypothetical protein [Spirochaetales bacterium]